MGKNANKKTKGNKKKFADTIKKILESRYNQLQRNSSLQDISNQLSNLGALKTLTQDKNSWNKTLSDVIKNPRIAKIPGFIDVCNNLKDGLNNGDIVKLKDYMQNDIFSSKDKEEINNYLILILISIERLLDEHINYVELTKEATLADIKLEKNFVFDKKGDEKFDLMKTDADRKFEKYIDKGENIEQIKLTVFITTTIVTHYIEQNKTNQKGQMPLKVTEKGLEHMLKTLKRLAKKLYLPPISN